jgi:Flp pilus assembly protein TadD
MNIRLYLCLSSLALLAACNQQTMTSSGSPSPVGPDTLNVADAAIAGGDPNMALSVSQSVLQTDPHNPDALVHEGDAFYALGRYPAAEASYNLALQYDPKNAAAETGLGRCLIKTDPKSAEAALELATQDDPGSAAAFNDLGIARDLQGNFAGAIQPYQQALVNQPGLVAAEINLGLSLALSGNGQAALQYLGPLATSQSSTPKIREDYAAALVAAGRQADARQALSIDLPPAQVQSALDGFNAIIAAAQTPLQPGNAAPPPPPPTTPQVQTASVAATPLMVSPAVTTPPAPPPAPVEAAPAPSTGNPNAAYVGPSPIPGAISSSAPGPGMAPPAPSPAPASKPAPAAPAPAQTAGAYQVQLGALPSQPDAQSQWKKISGANPALFGDKQPDIEQASVNGKTFYRLRTGSFASKADAAKFCGEVSAAGSQCTLANF